MADNDLDRTTHGVLGDINPVPEAHEPIRGGNVDAGADAEDLEPMEGGSRHDRTQHPGSRDLTEGVTGGTGTETGGTRNYRTGTGATGMDIGNRPE